MKNIDKKSIEKFINYGKEIDSDSLLGMMVGELILGAVGISWSNKPVVSAIFIIPFCILSCILYVIFRYKKHLNIEKYSKPKYVNFYLGLMGIVLSLSCQCCCIIYADVNYVSSIIILGALILSNLLVMLGISVLIYKIIAGTIKIGSTTGISFSVIGICALLGVLISENISHSYEKMIMPMVFAVLSLVFSAFISCIIKSYCIHLWDNNSFPEK